MKEYQYQRTVEHPEYNTFSGIVRLNNAQRLTPSVARRVLEIAFGQPRDGEVIDTEAGYGYRVYNKSYRKVYLS